MYTYNRTLEVFAVVKIVELYNLGTPTNVWHSTQSDPIKHSFPDRIDNWA